MAKPIELKFCGKLPLGPGMVLDYKVFGSIPRLRNSWANWAEIYCTTIPMNTTLIDMKFCGNLPRGPEMALDTLFLNAYPQQALALSSI